MVCSRRASVAVFLWMAVAAACRGQAVSPVDHVDPRIGTAGDGQTFPGAGVPFGMTQWTPQTRAGEVKCIAPYYAADTRIQGFRGTHFLSGSCTQDYGSVTLMPLGGGATGPLNAPGRSAAFDRASERAHPHAYTVDLAGANPVHVDVTGTERSGLLRFRFAPGETHAAVVVDDNVRLGTGTVQIDPERQEISGSNPVHRIYAGNGKPAGFSGYFVVQFSRRFQVGGTWAGSARTPGATSIAVPARGGGAYVTFTLDGSREVLARVGTSFTGIEEARRNLREEIPGWNFATVAEESRQKWSAALRRIDLPPETPADQAAMLYTALYHAMQVPRTVSDRSGAYPRFAGGGVEHADGWTYYDDFSIWDTFRAVHPLFTLLEPDREQDMVRSLVAKGEQGGFLPIFPAWNSYTSEMVGDHADAVIADAWVKGLRGFDMAAAYRLMRKNATELPKDHAAYVDGQGRRGLDSYLRYGFIPLEDHIPDAFHKDEQVSRTLEYAYDDWVLSRMAASLGHTADAAAFAERAGNWRKVLDPQTGYVRGRHADGTWVTPFDPDGKYTWITEGLPSIYTFFVPQDVPGLAAAVGGPDALEGKLDRLFDSGSYDHGNEPSHHIAFLYNAIGRPEKTQRRVREILRKNYRASTDGLAGNDDAGQMSAWFVFASMGLYPVTPGTDRYELASPLFDRVSVHLPNGKTLRIRAEGTGQGRYRVLRITLNGKPLDRTWINHGELLGGGDLNFELAPDHL